MYRCSKCSLPVVVLPNLIVRQCECVAPIIAEMQSVLAGKGGVSA